jgi:hypothetical protein
MRRRDFITLLGGLAAAWPLMASAQQLERMWRIGVPVGFSESDRQIQPRLKAFRERLQELGWTDGRNVEIIYRWSAADRGRMRSYADELVKLAPALDQRLQAEAVLAPRNPMVGSLAACCACPATGHATAPPNRMINSRRVIQLPRRRA